MRAPLTGAIFAVELTGDLALLPAALAGAATGYAVTVLLMKRSILTEKIARRGQHVTREYGIDPFELARAADLMVREVDSLSAALPLDEAVAALAQGRHRIYPVVDAQDRPVGLVSRADALRWSLEESAGDGATLGERLSNAALATVAPSDTAAWAAEVMVASDQGRLPVVDPATGALIGLLTRKDLLKVRAAASLEDDERRAFFTIRRSPSQMAAMQA